MLDIQYIRTNEEQIKKEILNRNLHLNLKDLCDVDDTRKDLIKKIDALREEKNKISKQVPSLNKTEKKTAIEKVKKITQDDKQLSQEYDEIKRKYDQLMLEVPNISRDMPVGPDASGNVVEKTWGKKPEFDFPPKDHMELGTTLDLIDKERGTKISGSRFYFVKGDLVRLQLATVNFVMDFLRERGYVPMIVPTLVHHRAMMGTGYFPAEPHEYYKITGDEKKKQDDLYLIGTSEVSLVAYHSGDLLQETELPKKFTAYTPCYRREAGSYGKDTKGIFRVHQFDKVEMVQLVQPDKSWEEFDHIIENAEEIVQKLNLPYQKLNMCSGDVSPWTAKKYDIEAWVPSQGTYREIMSGTNATDFQTRRLGIKYVTSSGKKEFVHSLNCTASAFPRMLIMIMENYQQRDGSIIIPDVLRPYMNNQERITAS